MLPQHSMICHYTQFYDENCSFLFILSYWIVYRICDSAFSLYHASVCAYKFRHVFLVEKCRLWGTWDVEWVVRIDDIMAVPHIADKKLVFKVRQVSWRNTHMLWILSHCKWCGTVQKKVAVTFCNVSSENLSGCTKEDNENVSQDRWSLGQGWNWNPPDEQWMIKLYTAMW